MPIITFTSSNAAWPWSAIAPVTQVTAYAIGAGGAATGNPASGGGGKGGSFASVVITKGAEATLNITVPTGPVGAATAGVAGGVATVVQGASTVLSAPGGAGGALAATASTNGAGGSTINGAFVGATQFTGGNGGTGNFTAGVQGSGAGGGAAGPTGNGGAASVNVAGSGSGLNAGTGAAGVGDSTGGATGSTYGGGGSGGKANANPDRNGGNGAPGVVWFEYTATPTRGRVSWAEFDVPTLTPTRGLISWAELDVPTVPTTARVSWAELDVPLPLRARVSWAELDVPAPLPQGRIAWAELETPEAGPAKTFALSNVERSGAARSGYVSGLAFVNEGGVQIGHGRADLDDPTSGILMDTLTITDALDEIANRCTYRRKGIAAIGTEVIVTRGSKNGARIFAGFILSTNQVYALIPQHVQTEVAAVDYTWFFSFLKVTARYVQQSATAIAQDLVARFAGGNGFTSTNVVANLPVLDEITFTDEDLGDAMTRLARRIGAYWYVDYFKDIHLFFDEVGNGAPVALTFAHTSLSNVASAIDRTQALTRVYVEGRGSRLISDVAVGDTMAPLQAVDMFTVASDVFLKATFQGAEGGAQHLNFSGVEVGGAGSLIGPGSGPPGLLTLYVVAGNYQYTGAYQYAYTDVTASGETLPSPLATVTVGGVIPNPATTPIVTGSVNTALTGGPDPGTHQWAVTFTTASGETLPSPISAPVAMTAPLGPPQSGAWVMAETAGGDMHDGWYGYVVTAIGSAGGETVADLGRVGVVKVTRDAIQFTQIPAGPPGTVSRKLYRTHDSDASYKPPAGPFNFCANIPGNNPVVSYLDGMNDRDLGALVPTVNTALVRLGASVPLELGGAGVTGRKLYRSAAGGSQLKLVGPIANNTETVAYDATVTDAALGAAPPAISTAASNLNWVHVYDIAIGPAGTTARKVYRTVKNGSALKFAFTVADNTTTAVPDVVVDESLGAAPPVSDTSGLTQKTGQVPAGSVTIPVANPAPFRVAGGWAIIGNGDQVVRYTGTSGNNLVGIPASGIGAIVAPIAYNSSVTTASMLTGIPASGARSISTRPLTAGDEIYLVVQVDDAAAQAILAAAMKAGAGIREEWVQDRRLAIPEARARGRATLQWRALDQRTMSYSCRDTRTAAGKTITVSLGAPMSIGGAFKIQNVTISGFRPFPTQQPTYTVDASSARFSFEDLLRILKTKD